MALPLGLDQTEQMRAPVGHDTASSDAMDRWLEAALELATNFPPGQISIGRSQQERAIGLLNEVQAELSAAGQDIVQYFETSLPRYEYTLSLALNQNRGRVLDLGCSPGHLAMALSKAGFQVQGVDLNAVWLSKYAPGWPERLRITHTNIEQDPLPFASDSFDLVIFTEVLEHIAITDPCVILQEIRRVLRPGGRMILSTPNVANLSNVVAFVQGENVFWPPNMFYGSVDRHNREYTPAELLQLVQKAEFTQYALGYMNTWSNWNHTTATLFHRLLDRSERGLRLERHPLFNNTLFMVATR